MKESAKRDYDQLIKGSGESVSTISSRKFGRIAGLGKTRAAEVLKELRSINGGTPLKKQAVKEELSESNEIVGDKWTIHMPKTRICTLEQLLEHCKVDLTQWSVERFVCNKWEVGVGDGLGNVIVEPLFQVKANLVRAKGMTVAAVKEEIASLQAMAKSTIKAPAIKFSKTIKNGNCLELSLYDAHFGRLSWGEETLWENYDLNIASIEYDRAMDALLSRASLDVEEIVYVVGNDLIHFDNLTNTTTRGTPQDVDGRFHKVFKRTREVVQRQIEKIRQIAPVKLYIVPGNHDTLSTWHLGDSLECYYHNTKNIEVFNDPSPRKYYTWGDNLIMYCHGDNGKDKDYPLLMATERPALWAAAKHREVHCGHYHQDKVKEIMGCKVRKIPALCPPDNWHSKSGYVGNIRAAQGFVWNKKEGLIGTAEYSILNPAE